MGRLANKNIVFLIPKDYYCEEELEPLMEIFKEEEANIKIASPKFKEAIGMRRGRIMPDMLIVDAMEGITGDSYVTAAKGTRQIMGVFHGAIVMGGKGAKHSLWNDKLITLLLSDRHRSHMIVAAIGMGVPCLGHAGLIQSMEVTVCNDKSAIEEIDKANGFVVDENVMANDNIITARDSSAVEEFAEHIITAVAKTNLK